MGALTIKKALADPKLREQIEMYEGGMFYAKLYFEVLITKYSISEVHPLSNVGLPLQDSFILSYFKFSVPGVEDFPQRKKFCQAAFLSIFQKDKEIFTRGISQATGKRTRLYTYKNILMQGYEDYYFRLKFWGFKNAGKPQTIGVEMNGIRIMNSLKVV